MSLAHDPVEGHGLAQRIGTEPVIWFGCSRRELQRLAVAGVLLSAPLTTGVCALGVGFRNWIPYFLLIALLSAWLLITTFERLKKGRPEGEVYQTFYLLLERARLTRTYLCLPPLQLTLGKTETRHVHFLE